MVEWFNGIEVLWISRFDYRNDWVLSPHTHRDFYQLIYCIDGSSTLVLNGQRYPFSSRMLVFLHPGVKHGFVDFGRKGMKTLDTKFKIHSRKMAIFCKQLPTIIPHVGGDIYDQLESIRENGITHDILYEDSCRFLLAQILIRLLRITNDEKRKVLSAKNFTPTRELSPLSNKVLKYIMAHCEEPLDSLAMERDLHYSYRYLSKFFHREMDMTPVQFARHCKVLRAKELLENSKMEIKNISETLGYADVHEFSRSFKKVTGMPPGHWKEIAQSGICQDVVIHSGFENTLFIEKLPT